jgi:flagellar M-ring protein FliF
VVQGIQYLVSSSVGGMQSASVMVLDDAGRLLSAPNDGASALTNRQLEMRREVERHLEEKAGELVAQVVGAGNARVQVSAEVNFDRVERTTESMDPDGQVAATEQLSEIIPGAEGGAGSRTSATTYDNSRRMETLSSAGGNVSRVTVAVLVNNRQVGTGEDARLEPRSREELDGIQTLVERAVGFNAQRGDAVSVVSLAFTGAAPFTENPAMDVVGIAHDFMRPILTLIALLLAFVVALKVIRTLRPEPAVQPATLALAGAEGAAALPALESGESIPSQAAQEALPEEKPRSMLPSTREKVETLIAEQPDVAARLIRTWLQESGT